MSFVPVKKLRPNAMLPTYGSTEAAGADLYACLDEPVSIEPHKTVFIPTGLSMELPKGTGGFIMARSGLACKQDLAPANKVGLIDSDYRGEFMVALHNHGSQMRTVQHGDRIAQLVIVPVLTPQYIETSELNETNRGIGGFGSTGQ
jgi:dUTP pyrophosphatase